MSAVALKTLHSMYKNIKRMKPLIEFQANRGSSVKDTVDVFCARLKELEKRINFERATENISEIDKIRLSAMQLASQYEHITILMQYSKSEWTRKLKIIENSLQTYDSIRSNRIMFFVYFKTVNFVANVNYDLKSSDVAKHWLNVAEQMYAERQSSDFFDCDELFSKSIQLKPMNHGLNTVDDLFEKNNQIRKLIEPTNTNPMQYDQSVKWLLENYKTENQRHWLEKLISMAQQLLEQSQYKLAAYFLLIANKVSQQFVECQITIKSSIASNWMSYTFAVLNDLTKHRMLNDSSECEFYTIENIRENALDTRKLIANRKLFNCFSSMIPLPLNDILLCTNSVRKFDEAHTLLTHSIKMIKELIKNSRLIDHPVNYISHNYQLSDMMSTLAKFTPNVSDCCSIHTERVRYFGQMIQWLKSHRLDVFNILNADILLDFNNIVIDLYATNYFYNLTTNTTLTNEQQQSCHDLMKRKLSELIELNACLLDHRHENQIKATTF